MTTQAPHAIRTVFALVAGHVGLTEEKIRIISPDIGVGFGGKVPGWEYDSGNYEAALKKAMAIIGYDQLRKEQTEKRKKGF